ncbi:MAG TPA: cytochrome c oxidase subunit II [Terriglobales bacterium]|nr:cytochrome c oxidase subunit II [Terriglobales bacterium]
MLQRLPENVSTYGENIDWMFHLIYYVTGITFAVVFALLIAFVIMFRARPGRRAVYTHGNSTMEIAWTIAPAVLLIALGFMSKSQWEAIKLTQPPADVTVRVTGRQFNWIVQYAGPDGNFDSEADNKEAFDELHVPVNKVVHIKLRAKEVIHSLFVPQLRLKQDALPGREITVWFEATKAGEYEMPCAELCGFGHSGMNGKLIVHETEDYEKWVKEQWPS